MYQIQPYQTQAQAFLPYFGLNFGQKSPVQSVAIQGSPGLTSGGTKVPDNYEKVLMVQMIIQGVLQIIQSIKEMFLSGSNGNTGTVQSGAVGSEWEVPAGVNDWPADFGGLKLNAGEQKEESSFSFKDLLSTGMDIASFFVPGGFLGKIFGGAGGLVSKGVSLIKKLF